MFDPKQRHMHKGIFSVNRFAILDYSIISVHKAIKAQRHLHNDKSSVAPSESAKWISAVRMNDNERATRIFDTRVRNAHTHTRTLSVSLYRSSTDLANSQPVLHAMHVRDVRDTAISWHCTLHPPLRRVRLASRCTACGSRAHTQSRDSRQAHDLGIDLAREISFRFRPHPLFESTRSNPVAEEEETIRSAARLAAKIARRGNEANDTKIESGLRPIRYCRFITVFVCSTRVRL